MGKTFGLKPLEDRIAVHPSEDNDTTASGLVIPDAAKERPQEGEVMAVGPGRFEDGQRIPMDVRVGDRVIYAKYGGTEVKVDGEECLILSAHDDREGTLGHEAMHTSWWQVFLSAAGMIAVINSVLAGSFVGLLLAAFIFPLWACTSAGVVAFLVSLVLHQTNRIPPTTAVLRWRQKVSGVVTPSPVGPAIENDRTPSPPRPRPAGLGPLMTKTVQSISLPIFDITDVSRECSTAVWP